jgi:serine/threonine-protein kinase RsbW
MSGHHDSDRCPVPAHDAITEDFTVSDLGRVRRLIERAAAAAGLRRSTTDDLVVAVNEIVINAVVHAGGGGSVTVEASVDGVGVEVRDNGPGLPIEPPVVRPGPQVEGGRGLWMARTLCRRLTITNGPAGATVRLFMPAA